jgi:pantoate--beta-alanine ligase
MQELADGWRRTGKRVGLVPTMGALHAGHVSLVKASLASCDRTVVSIFVNPIQFGPREDLAKYPRPFPRDVRILRGLGVDAVYHPSVSTMYPPGFSTSVDVGGTLTAGLCGPRRPGHFRGVATVVAKLFNAVRPHAAFFGAKDFQQAAVVRRMAADLDTGISVVVMPTVREPDGVAMSSRNRYLAPDERLAARALSRALAAGKAEIAGGNRSAASVRASMRRVLHAEPLARVEYLDITDAETLAPVTRLSGRVLMALAVRIGGTRLIDNMTAVAGARKGPERKRRNK